MSDTAKSSMDTGVLIDQYDFQSLLTNARMPLSRGDINTTTFGRGDMESNSAMRNGVLNIEGFRKGDWKQYEALVNQMMVDDTTPHIVTYTPDGEKFGAYSYLIESNQSSAEVNGPSNQAVMVTAVFNATGGPRMGRMLNTLRGAAYSYSPGTFHISVNNLPANTQVAFLANNVVGAPSPFGNLGALTDNAVVAAILKAMPSYAARDATVTNDLVANNGNITGTINIKFTGAGRPTDVVLIGNDGAIIGRTTYTGFLDNNFIYTAASGNGQSLDWGAASASGFTAHFHVLDSISAGNLNSTITAKIQHSVDNVNWNDLFAFDPIAIAGKQRTISATPHAIVQRYTRGVITLANANRTYAYGLALSRFGRVH